MFIWKFKWIFSLDYSSPPPPALFSNQFALYSKYQECMSACMAMRNHSCFVDFIDLRRRHHFYPTTCTLYTGQYNIYMSIYAFVGVYLYILKYTHFQFISLTYTIRNWSRCWCRCWCWWFRVIYSVSMWFWYFPPILSSCSPCCLINFCTKEYWGNISFGKDFELNFDWKVLKFSSY